MYDRIVGPILVTRLFIIFPAFVSFNLSVTTVNAFFAVSCAIVAIARGPCLIALIPFLTVAAPFFTREPTFPAPVLIPFHAFEPAFVIALPAFPNTPSCFLSFQSA